MSRYRNTNERRARFTMLQNTMLRDKTLSLKAKGLLSVMLSYPDDWTYYMEHLIGQSTDGREAHQNAMKELLAAGYVRRTPAKNLETGKLSGWEYLVSDEKLPAETGKTDGRESRQTGNLPDGKPAATNTDYTKTEDTKTETPPTPQGEKGLVLPDWMPEELWGEWQQHRKEMKKPVTPTSAKRLLISLEQAKAQGHNPVALLEEAITRSWLAPVIPQSGVVAKGSAPRRAGRPATQADVDQKFVEDVEDIAQSVRGIFND